MDRRSFLQLIGLSPVIIPCLELGQEERKYPCPKCRTGELYDANSGGMFMAQIRCTECDYEMDDY